MERRTPIETYMKLCSRKIACGLQGGAIAVQGSLEEGLVICMPADGMITINIQVEVATILRKGPTAVT